MLPKNKTAININDAKTTNDTSHVLTGHWVRPVGLFDKQTIETIIRGANAIVASYKGGQPSLMCIGLSITSIVETSRSTSSDLMATHRALTLELALMIDRPLVKEAKTPINRVPTVRFRDYYSVWRHVDYIVHFHVGLHTNTHTITYTAHTFILWFKTDTYHNVSVLIHKLKVCACVYNCVCECVCRPTWKCTLNAHTHAAPTHMHTHAHTHTRAHTHAHIHARHKHTPIPTHTHAHTHKHAHTSTHTNKQYYN